MKMHQNMQPRSPIQAKHMQKPIYTPHRGRTPAQQRPRLSQEPTHRTGWPCAQPRVRAHGPQLCSSSAFNARGCGYMWYFPKIRANRPPPSLYKKTSLPIQQSIIHIWRRRRGLHTFPLAYSYTSQGVREGTTQRNSRVVVPSTSCTRRALYIGWMECRICRLPSTLVPLQTSCYLE